VVYLYGLCLVFTGGGYTQPTTLLSYPCSCSAHRRRLASCFCYR